MEESPTTVSVTISGTSKPLSPQAITNAFAAAGVIHAEVIWKSEEGPVPDPLLHVTVRTGRRVAAGAISPNQQSAAGLATCVRTLLRQDS